MFGKYVNAWQKLKCFLDNIWITLSMAIILVERAILRELTVRMHKGNIITVTKHGRSTSEQLQIYAIICVNSPARAFACSQTTDLCRLKIKVSYNDSLFVSLKQIEYFFLPFAFGFWTNQIEISSENVNSAFYFA